MPSFIGSRPIHARSAYLWWEGTWSLLHTVAFTLSLLYQVQVAHLSPAQMVLLGTAMEAACFLFEVPTSVIADVFSRRLSALVGALVVGVAILLQGLFPTFWVLMLAQVVWGLGYTCISGAVDAWITDEVGEEHVQPLFTRFQQLSLALTFVGILVAGGLGQVSLRLPMLVAGAGYLVLALVMAPLMPEAGFTPAPREERSSWGAVRETFLTGVAAARRPGLVRSFLLIALLAGLASEVVDRLWAARVVDQLGLPGVPLPGADDATTWFTVFALVGALVSLAVSLLANRYAAGFLAAEHPRGVLALLVLVQVVGIVAFALVGSLWVAMAFLWLRDAARALAWPVQAAWLNRSISSQARATTLSITAQADAIGQVVGGPSLGLAASRWGIPAAMCAAAAILAPAAPAYLGSKTPPEAEGVTGE